MNKPFFPLSREDIAIRALGLKRDPLAGELIALEPRMVFDGAGLAIATDAVKQASDTSSSTQTDATKTITDAAAELAKNIAAAAVPVPPAPAPVEVVFIDSRVSDIDSFKKSAGDNRLVVMVDAQDDGIAKITDTLKGLHDISAVHIVGHGTEGAFELGKNWIGLEEIKAHESDIQSWTQSLALGADILLYGCDIAKGAAGEQLITTLAQESGRDVAASGDGVGQTDHGADWTLEKTKGAIEAQVIVPENYAFDLAPTADVTPSHYTDDKSPITGTNITLVRGVSNAVTNWTNDTTPTFAVIASSASTSGSIAGATVRLYVEQGTSNWVLAGSAVVNTDKTFTVTVGTFVAADSAKPKITILPDGALKMQLRQTGPNASDTESPGTDPNSTFIMNIKTSAPPVLQPSQLTFGGGVVDPTKTYEVTSVFSNVTITLNAAQKAAVQNVGWRVLLGRVNSSGVTVQASFRDAVGVLTGNSTTFGPLALSGGSYTDTDPTAGVEATETYYFYLADGAGNYIDGDGNIGTSPAAALSNTKITMHLVQLAPLVKGSISDDVGSPATSSTGNLVATDDPTPTFTGSGYSPDTVMKIRVITYPVGVAGITGGSRTTLKDLTEAEVNLTNDASGNFSFTLPASLNLVDKSYTVQVWTSKVQDVSGTPITYSSSVIEYNFNLVRTPATFDVADKFGPVQTNNFSGTALVDALTLTGTSLAAPRSTINLEVVITNINLSRNGTDLVETPAAPVTKTYSVTVRDNWTWSFALPSSDLGSGLKTISIKSTDANGLTSTSSPVRVLLTGAWTPGGVGQNGLSFWYDPMASGGIIKDASNNVSSMKDLSGNGLDATQANAANKPIFVTDSNGRSYLAFTSSRTATSNGINAPTLSINTSVADLLSLPTLVSAQSFVYVGQYALADNSLTITQPSSSTTPFNSSIAGTGAINFGFYASGNPGLAYSSATVGQINSNFASPLNTTINDALWLSGIISNPWTGTGSAVPTVTVDGVSVSIPTVSYGNLMSFASIGARFSGQIGAIIGYSRGLSAAEVRVMSNAQSQQYGISLGAGVSDLYVVVTKTGSSAAEIAAAQQLYSYDIGGISKTGTATLATSSNGGLMITNASFFGANDASILFGNNGQTSSFGPTTIADPANPGVTRFDRFWAVDVTGGTVGGKVDVAFDVASLAAQAGESYDSFLQKFNGRKGMSLAWRANDADPWSVISSSDSDVVLAGGKVTFAGVTVGAGGLQDGFLTLIDGPSVSSITRTNVVVGASDTTATFKVSFSENVTGLTPSSFKLLTGDLIVAPSAPIVGSVQTDGLGNFWANVTVSYKNGSGYVGLDYDFTQITGVDDGAQNAGNVMVKTVYARTDSLANDPDTPSYNMVLDKTLLGQPSSATGSAIVSINFLELGIGLGVDDFVILDQNNVDVTSNFILTADTSNPAPTNSASLYKFKLAQKTGGAPDGAYKLALKASSNAWRDVSGNQATPDATANMVLSQAFSVDTTPPSIASVIRTDASGNPLNALTRADVLTYKVTFSEFVQNVDATDFSIIGPTGAQIADMNLSLSAFAGDTTGKVYLVTVSDKSGKTTLTNYNGVISLGIAPPPTQNVFDTIGNPLSLTLPTGANYESYTVDNMAPIYGAQLSATAGPQTAVYPDVTYIRDTSWKIDQPLSVYGFAADEKPQISLDGGLTYADVTAVKQNNGVYQYYWTFNEGDVFESNTVVIRVIDTAGNITTGFPVPTKFIVDKTPPAVPVISGFTDDVGPLQGNFTTPGKTTDDLKPTFFGTADAGSTVFLRYNPVLSSGAFGPVVELGSVTLGATQTSWSFTPTSNMPSGGYAVSAYAKDRALNQSSNGLSFSLAVDGTTPAVPVISGFVDDVGNLTSTSAAPSVSGVTTDDISPLLVGTAAGGGKVDIFEGATKIGTATVDAITKTWSYQLSGVTSGTHNYTAKYINLAEVTSAATSNFTIKVDTTVVSAPTFVLANDTGRYVDDYVTKDGLVNVSGIASGATWQYSLNKGVTWATGTGTSFTLPQLTGGNKYQVGDVQVRQTSQSGNVSAVTSNNNIIWVDLTAPSSSGSLQFPDLHVDSSNPNNIKIVGADYFYASDYAAQTSGGYLRYSLDGGTNWLLSSDGFVHLLDGFYPKNTIKTQLIDLAGNSSSIGGIFTDLTVINTPPDPLVLTLPADTGIPSDGVTKNKTATVSGLVSTRATWEYSIDGGVNFTLGSDTSFNLDDGTYASGLIQVRQIYFSLVSTIASNSAALTIDTAGPEVIWATDKASLKAGETATITFTASEAIDGLTASDFTVSGGTLSALTQSSGNSKVYTATFSPAANFKGTASVNLSGAYTDLAGNAGTLKTPVELTVDTTAPTISSLAISAAGAQNNYLNTGDIVTVTASVSQAVTVSGGTPRIALNVGGVTRYATYASGSGSTSLIFTYTVQAPDTDANGVSIGADALDLNGATIISPVSSNNLVLGNSAISDVVTLLVDTTAPSLTITASTAALKIGETATITFTISEEAVGFDASDIAATNGTLSNFARVGTSNVYTATFTPSASFEGTANISLSGSYTDLAGNAGTGPSSALSLTIDTKAPTAPTISSVNDNVDPVQGFVANNGFTNDTTPTLTITAEAGSVVKVYDGTTLLGTATETSTAGTFTFTTAALTGGNHSFTVKATDGAGNDSAASTAYAVTIDTSAPVKPVISSVTDDASPVIGSIANNGYTNDTTPTLTITAETGSVVKVYDGTTLLGTATETSTAGTFTFTTAALTADIHTFTVTSTDASGNQSVASTSHTITIDTTKPPAPVLTLSTDSGSNATDRVTNDATITLTAEAGTSVVVTYQIGSKTVTKPTYTGGGAVPLIIILTPQDFSDLGDGPVTVTAVATDAAGNASDAGTTSFTLDRTAPTLALSSSATSFKAGETATITLTLSELVTGLDASDFNVTNGTLSNLVQSSNDPKVYTATFTPKPSFKGTASIEFKTTGGFADIAGNIGNAQSVTSGSLSFTLDTTAASISSLALTSQTGAQNDYLNERDTVTATVTFTEAVTVAGGTPQIALKIGNMTKLASYTGGSGSAILTFTYTIGAGETDTNGISLDTNVLSLNGADITTVSSGNAVVLGHAAVADNATYKVDTTKPDTPVLLLGTGVADGATSAEALASGGVVTLTAETDSSVIVTFTNGTKSVTKNLTGNGATPLAVTLSAADLATLGDGTISVSAKATDLAGNVSDVGSTSFKLDTVNPIKPVLTLGPGVGDGATGTEAKQDNGVVRVTAEADTDVTVTFTNGTKQVTKTVKGGGSNPVPVILTQNDLDTLGEGPISVSAISKDAAGNESDGGTISFTLDTIVPTVTVTSSSTALKIGETAILTFEASEELLDLTVDDFSIAHGKLSNFVRSSSNPKIYTATFTPDAGFEGQGGVTLIGSFTDKAGNAGSLKPFAGIAIDTKAPVVALSNYDDNVDPQSGIFALSTPTNDPTPTFNGTGENGASVEMFRRDGSNLVSLGITTIVNGKWSITPGTGLGEGAYPIFARVTDGAGNSVDTPDSTFVIDKGTSGKLDGYDDGSGMPDVAKPFDTPAQSIDLKFVGQAEKGARVDVYRRDGTKLILIGSGKADPVTGKYSVKNDVTLEEGDSTIFVRITDAAGNVLDTSDTKLTIALPRVTSSPPEVPFIDVKKPVVSSSENSFKSSALDNVVQASFGAPIAFLYDVKSVQSVVVTPDAKVLPRDVTGTIGSGDRSAPTQLPAVEYSSFLRPSFIEISVLVRDSRTGFVAARSEAPQVDDVRVTTRTEYAPFVEDMRTGRILVRRDGPSEIRMQVEIKMQDGSVIQQSIRVDVRSGQFEILPGGTTSVSPQSLDQQLASVLWGDMRDLIELFEDAPAG